MPLPLTNPAPSLRPLSPGPGVLTHKLLGTSASRIVGVESSHKFVPRLEKLANCDERLRIFHGDLQKLDLDEGCPPSSALLQNVPKTPWDAGACPAC